MFIVLTIGRKANLQFVKQWDQNKMSEYLQSNSSKSDSFNFDKTLSKNIGYGCASRVGENLINFIETDLSTISQMLECIRPQAINVTSILPALEKFQNILWDINPYVLLEYQKVIRSYINKIYEYLNDEDMAIKLYKELYDELCKINLTIAQDIYKKALCYCLDEDAKDLNELSTPQRYYLYSILIGWNITTDKLGTEIDFLPVNKTQNELSKKFDNIGLHPNRMLHFLDDLPNELKNSILNVTDGKIYDIKQLVSIMKGHSTEIIESIEINSIFSLCYIEFMKMVTMDIKIKKCSNCNKYFVLYDDYKVMYCDRVPEGETKTCREIGAIRKYAKNVKSNPILEAYNRAYKTHFARIKYKKITKEEFYKWSEAAAIMRDKAKIEEISLNEFKEWLKK